MANNTRVHANIRALQYDFRIHSIYSQSWNGLRLFRLIIQMPTYVDSYH